MLSGFCSMGGGKRAAARQTLSKAEETYAQNRAKLTNAVFLEQLALTQDEMGDEAGAGKTKRALAKASGRTVWIADDFGGSWFNSDSSKLRVAGRTETEKGNLNGAQSNLRAAADSIDTVPQASDRAILLYMIAIDQANAHDPAGARSTFARAVDRAFALPKGQEKELIIRDIASEQASAGYIEDSLVTAAKISDSHCKDQALQTIAVAEVERVNLEADLKTAAQIQSQEEYDIALVNTAQYLGKQKTPASIDFVVDKIHSPYMKALGLIEAAEAIVAK